MTDCKNCGNMFKGKFCSSCGQPADTQKVNLHFLWHDVQHGLFHFDKGVFYIVKELFTRPGHSIREFIAGRMVNHFKPVSMVVLLAALYGFLYHYYGINLFVPKTEDSKELHKNINHWTSNHYS